MGAGGVPNHRVQYVETKRLDKNGLPRTLIHRTENGKVVQSRWYDDKGRAIRNRDYSHSDNGGKITFPHDHIWNWSINNGERGKDHFEPDYNNYPNQF